MGESQQNQIVMFADVAGSAALFERLGEQEAAHAVERCLKRIRRSIDGHNGTVEEIVGDEVFASFPSADNACAAAIDMQLRITDLPPVSGLKLAIRIGLHAGRARRDEGRLQGSALTTAARITGKARRDQILCSSAFIAAMSEHGAIIADPLTGQVEVQEEGVALTLFQIHWASFQAGVYSALSTFGGAAATGERLRLQFRGKTYLMDDKTPVLTIGRDLGCAMIVIDRKASRQHARIEKRNDGYYLIDASSNGSFVTIAGRHEVMIRRQEILLEKNGSLSFGLTGNDPQADLAVFEHC